MSLVPKPLLAKFVQSHLLVDCTFQPFLVLCHPLIHIPRYVNVYHHIFFHHCQLQLCLVSKHQLLNHTELSNPIRSYTLHCWWHFLTYTISMSFQDHIFPIISIKILICIIILVFVFFLFQFATLTECKIVSFLQSHILERGHSLLLSIWDLMHLILRVCSWLLHISALVHHFRSPFLSYLQLFILSFPFIFEVSLLYQFHFPFVQSLFSILFLKYLWVCYIFTR